MRHRALKDAKVDARKRHGNAAKTQASASQTVTSDVPLACVVRIMAFAGMLGKLDSLCQEYRTIQLGKRMLYSESFKWNFMGSSDKMPSSIAGLRHLTGWDNVHSMLTEIEECLIPHDAAYVRERNAAHRRREHLRTFRPLYRHDSTVLRMHRRRQLAHYTSLPDELYDSLMTDDEWDRTLLAHRRSLFPPLCRRLDIYDRRHLLTRALTHRMPPLFNAFVY
jgi:hypothetical protein